MFLKKPIAVAVIALGLSFGNGVLANVEERRSLLDFDTLDIIDSMGDALSLQDEIRTLEPSKFFGRDQKTARSEMDKILADAVHLFESSQISDLRAQYSALERKIAKEQQALSKLRSERVIAPVKTESLATKLMPGDLLKRMTASTRADYDRVIASAEENIQEYEASKQQVVEELRLALQLLGLNLNHQQLVSLLTSVVGDGIVEMVVTFNAIKDVTAQLALMAAETGEDLEHSKRYYGMVVVMHRMVSLMQSRFVDDIKNVYLPKLNTFESEADANIKQSRKLMSGSDNRSILQANIEANELTREVVRLYSQMLKQQQKQIESSLKVTNRQLSVAENTYNTVALSSSVVSMIREGSRTFDQLLALQTPDIRVFKNEQMLTEFRRLTAELKATE